MMKSRLSILLCSLFSLCSIQCSAAFLPGQQQLDGRVLAVWLIHPPWNYSRFLFAVSALDTTMRSYRIDSATGALTQVTAFPTISGIGIDIHPTLSYVYLANNSVDGVIAAQFDTTGALTSAGSISTGNANTHRVKVHPTGNAIYFNSVQAGNTRMFRAPLNSGSMGAAVLQNASEPSNSQFMTLDPTGRFLYGTISGTGGVNTFTTNGGASLTAQGNTLISGTEEPVRAQFLSDGSGMFLYTTSSGRLMSYSINSTTGMPTPVSNISVNVGALFIHPNQGYLYAGDTASGGLRLYRINADKSLTFVNYYTGMGGVSYDNGCFERGGQFLFLTKANATGVIQVVKINADLSPTLASSLTTGGNLGECTTSIDSYWP